MVAAGVCCRTYALMNPKNPVPSLSHPRYRPDIDGLRAIAVLSVVVFHAFPSLLPGGFVGVDVFFVISGYLISTIILGNLAQGHFSFAGFYARRIRRIFPALAVVLAFCLAAGWFALYADDYALLGKHVAGGAGFVSNLVLWSESGYFDQSAKLKPLLHLWSLGIEEQFYLLWPLILFIGWRTRTDMAKLVGALAVVSLLIGLWMTRQDPVAAFYAPWARFWELLAGGLLAVMHLRHRQRELAGGDGDLPTEESTLPPMANAMSLGGLLLIAIACVAFGAGDPFPGWRALLPTVGTCLLIAAGHSAIANRRLLSLAPMRWVGEISYPLYLWHWVLLAYINIKHPEYAPASLRGLAVVASVLLATLTYYLVERPLRFGGRGRTKTLGLLVAMAMLAALGLTVMACRGFVGRFPSAVALYTNYTYDFRTDARTGRCWISEKAATSGYAGECVDTGTAETPMLLLWGDSFMGRLYPGLKKVAGEKVRFAEYARNGCRPYFSGVKPYCRSNNRYVLSRVAALKPRAVLLFANWNFLEMPSKPEAVFARLSGTIRQLRKTGARRIVILGPVPQWTPTLPKSLLALYSKAPYLRAPRRTAFGQVESAHRLDAFLKQRLRGIEDVTYLSTIDAMCTAEGCLTWIGSPDELTTWDRGHLTTAGAAYLANQLDLVGRATRDDWTQPPPQQAPNPATSSTTAAPTH